MDPAHSSAMESAILSVLSGTPIEAAAAAARTLPARLADAAHRYRAAGQATLDLQAAGWHQVNVEFADYPTAERSFRAYLLPALNTEPIRAWWFIRKRPCWRLRIQPATGAHLAEALDGTLTSGEAKRWWAFPYEPESLAFGGPHGMKLAHDLFHTDSVGVLAYHQHAADGTTGLLGAKETSLLIMTLFLRAAGLEWSEQGDVWGRVEARRPLPQDVSTDQVSRMVDPLRRLQTLDAAPALADGPLTPLRTWATGMTHGGRTLAAAARAGDLRLGLRGILARHILFHWNRMGFTTHQQAIWSRAAREATLGR